ncbi:class IIb bacteriocin, lactobin A/cerein 7B family [Sphingobacterium sp. LRF_L2]|uniref:class IIb bacteriocin, lactobin A/cerein 7B family n=1 Tax=Sphingobacterium sp. LRF_L2 TaxID=3369421 RepID=UPI003F61E4E7
MEALKLNQFGVEELDSRELTEVEGGVIPPLIIAGAIYAGAALGGAATGYGLYKLVDWIAN